MHPRSFTAAAACPSGDNYNTTSSSVTVTVAPVWGWGGEELWGGGEHLHFHPHSFHSLV